MCNCAAKPLVHHVRRRALPITRPLAPKSAHIRRRVKMAVGKTVEAALKMQVPDKDGDMVRYKKSDFKYDVKAGFLRF